MSSSTSSQLLWSETTDKTVQAALRSWTAELERKGKDAIQIGLPAKVSEIYNSNVRIG